MFLQQLWSIGGRTQTAVGVHLTCQRGEQDSLVIYAPCSRLSYYSAMEQNFSPQERDEQAWSLLLHQDCIVQDTNSICRLLCVSLSMQQAVHHHAAGQLKLNISVEQQGDHVGKRLGLWLASHAVLLRSLNIKQLSGLECSRPEKQQQIWHISSGIAAAQQHPMRPPVSSMSSNVCAKVLLEVLPNVDRGLTRLELGPACTDELQKHLSKAVASTASSRGSISPSPSASPCSSSTVFPTDSVQTTSTDSADQQDATAAASGGQDTTGYSSSTAQVPVPCSAVLASLPALSHLVLHGYAANTLLPCVQPCIQLRSVTLCNLLCPKAQLLRDMPAQLEELHVSVDPDYTSWQRKQRQPVLSHLTALTSLSCTGEGLFAVQADEVLPPNLMKLVVSDCPKAAPLLALRGLQVLAMQASTMDAHQLQQLRLGLPALREVQLGYDRGNMDAITAAAPGWPALAGIIRGLELRVYPGPLPAQTLGHLAKLGAGLTRLAISGFSVQVEATPAMFAATLRALPGLQELKLAYLRFKDQPVLPEAPLAPPPLALTAAAAAGLAANGDALAGAAAAPAGPEDEIGSDPAAAAAAGQVHASGLVVLMQQIAALPVLKSLSLHSMVLTGAPVGALAAVGGRLSALHLNECDLCDADVALLASRVTCLRKLALNWNFGVKSEGLRCLSGIKGLTELHVCCGTTRHEAALVELQQLLPGLIAVS